MVIIVKNLNPREQIVGDGEFKHIQCQNITDLKTQIRSKYNPKFKNVNQQINPLPRGVSHEHVIHGTDYQSQTDYLLEYFNLNTTSYYSRYDNLDYYIPWHLTVRSSDISETEVNIPDLRCNVLEKGLMKVKDSPHFKYVKGDKSEYQNYINKHIGKELQENHFCEAFDKLIDSYDPNYKADGKKSLVIINKNKVIQDGLHRCSVASLLGIDKMRCILI
jgi:hypothetical protein